MGQLVLQDRHGQVRDLGAADRAVLGISRRIGLIGDDKSRSPQGENSDSA